MLDLFGHPTRPTLYKHPGAYPEPPGTGPDGKACRDCQSYSLVQGGKRMHRKCKLMRAHWTHGPGTDIKASSPACRLFNEESQ